MAPHVEATCGALLFLGQPTDAAEAPTMKLFRPGQVADDTPNRKLQIHMDDFRVYKQLSVRFQPASGS